MPIDAAAIAPILPETKNNSEARLPAQPFIKWVGGKARLLAQFRPLLPSGVQRMRHLEPFIGGGAMFFGLAPERALLCDINPELVHTYNTVRDDVDGILRVLSQYEGAHDKEHYYALRARYNETRHDPRGTERAAMFIYLSKTCFNGLHRVNKKGEFNVPMGRYAKPNILNESGLRAASAALQGAEIRVAPFEALLESARPGDFVYLDPPYEPVSRTSNFTGYAKDGFGQDDQRRLRDVVRELDRRGCRVMLSNSDVPFIRELYADFNIDQVSAARAINSKASARGAVSEVVVRNYESAKQKTGLRLAASPARATSAPAPARPHSRRKRAESQ